MHRTDLAQVARLHHMVYGVPKTHADLIWRSEGHLALPEFRTLAHPTTCVVQAAGQIVASFGFFLRRGSLDERTLLMAEFFAAEVHPDWRGQRLFSRVIAFVVPQLAQAGIALITSIPSGGAINVSLTNGFVHVGDLELFEKRAPWLPLGQSHIAPKSSPRDTARPILRHERSQQARARRYDDRPDTTYRRVTTSLGDATLRIHDRIGRRVTICDLSPETPDPQVSALIAQVTTSLARFPGRVIWCWAVAGTPLSEALPPLGFKRVPQAHFPVLAQPTAAYQGPPVSSLVADMMIGDFDVG